MPKSKGIDCEALRYLADGRPSQYNPWKMTIETESIEISEYVKGDSPSPFDLAGRIALVTGGGTGIGASTAAALARFGATVVIASRNEERLRATAELINSAGKPNCHWIKTDISSEDEVVNLAKRLQDEFHHVDILINNAGGVYIQISKDWPAVELILETPSDRWREMMELNLTGAFLVTREIAPMMVAQQGGSIVNISSTGSHGLGGYAAYASAKAGLETFTRSAASELGRYGIRVNAISVGGIRTELPMQNQARSGVDMSQFGMGTALRRGGWPFEVAHAALFLASDAASYVNGTIVRVDGGQLLGVDKQS